VTSATQIDALVGRLLAHLDALEQELSAVRGEQHALLSGAHLQARKLLAACGLRNEGMA
jgi:hypothetical protein